ncbi:hypothetical protein EV361DRAFT_575082 [Lentinula raphanica]|nr:hypothetical protein EV361DRAFT_575082 [Lentinula raphanica]
MPHLLALPNEILPFIVGYIAHSPMLPRRPEFTSQLKTASPELLALSVVNRRLRQVCLPFLFANIKITRDEDVEAMETRLSWFSKYTKGLAIDDAGNVDSAEDSDDADADDTDDASHSAIDDADDSEDTDDADADDTDDASNSAIDDAGNGDDSDNAGHAEDSVMADTDDTDDTSHSAIDDAGHADDSDNVGHAEDSVMADTDDTSQTMYQNTIRFLSELEHLSYVELQDCRSPEVLRNILAHPKVSVVRVRELPDESMHDCDLSNVILDSQTYDPSESFSNVEKCLDSGMWLASLRIKHPDELDAEFGLRSFPGLRGLHIDVDLLLPSFDWLSTLSSTHTTLYRVMIRDVNSTGRHPSVLHQTTFLSSFDAKSRSQGLEGSFTVERIGLYRALPEQEWEVTGLALRTILRSASLVDIISLVASSFPRLEELMLNLDEGENSYKIDDLASAFAHFSCLNFVHLSNVFKRLSFDFGNDAIMTSELIDSSRLHEKVLINAACAESGIRQLAAELAKRIRTLYSFHIEDTGLIMVFPRFVPDQQWHIEGWLHVLNGNRDVGGKLGISTRILPMPAEGESEHYY